MRLTVLYFGLLKDLFGRASDSVSVEEGMTVAGLVLLLRGNASKPEMEQSPVWKALAVAVNREYADTARVLRDGDEVALLPPVSGGTETK